METSSEQMLAPRRAVLPLTPRSTPLSASAAAARLARRRDDAQVYCDPYEPFVPIVHSLKHGAGNGEEKRNGRLKVDEMVATTSPQLLDPTSHQNEHSCSSSSFTTRPFLPATPKSPPESSAIGSSDADSYVSNSASHKSMSFSRSSTSGSPQPKLHSSPALLARRLADVERNLDASEQHVERVSNEVLTLKNELAKKKKEAKELAESRAALIVRMTELEKHLSEFQYHADETVSELETTRQQLQIATDRLLRTEATHSASRLETERLKSLLKASEESNRSGEIQIRELSELVAAIQRDREQNDARMALLLDQTRGITEELELFRRGAAEHPDPPRRTVLGYPSGLAATSKQTGTWEIGDPIASSTMSLDPWHAREQGFMAAAPTPDSSQGRSSNLLPDNLVALSLSLPPSSIVATLSDPSLGCFPIRKLEFVGEGDSDLPRAPASSIREGKSAAAVELASGAHLVAEPAANGTLENDVVEHDDVPGSPWTDASVVAGHEEGPPAIFLPEPVPFSDRPSFNTTGLRSTMPYLPVSYPVVFSLSRGFVVLLNALFVWYLLMLLVDEPTLEHGTLGLARTELIARWLIGNVAWAEKQ